jgi:hypothetical protein
LHRHGPHGTGIEMLLDFRDQPAGLIPPDLQRFQNVRQVMVGKDDVHHRAAHGHHPTQAPGFGLTRGIRRIVIHRTHRRFPRVRTDCA